MTKFLLTLGVAAALAGGLLAQTTTGTTTGSTTGGNSTASGGNSGFQGMTLEGAPTITGGTSTGANVSGNNAFGQWYANPSYGGAPGSNGLNVPGGFGTAMSGGSSGGTAGRSSGFASRTNTGGGYGSSATSGASAARSSTGTSTAARSTTGSTGLSAPTAGAGFGSGFGGTGSTGMGRTGTGGFGSTGFGSTGFGNTGFGGRNSMMGGGTQQQAGILAPASRSIATRVNVRIPQRAIPHAEFHADLSNTLARSTFLSNPAGVNVHYDGKLVTLRGQVKDEEEARTAEGVMRLTPGVRAVKNELTYPKP